MFISLRTLARRRPGLVVLAVLYVVIAALVARSPITVALCTMIFASVAVQLAIAVHRARATSAAVPIKRI